MIDHDTLYLDLCMSLKKWAIDFIDDLDFKAEFIDWDAHASIHNLPDGDLFGLAGCGFSEDEGGFLEVVFGMGASTQRDDGLMRIRTMVSKAYGGLKAGTQLVLYSSSNAAPITYMQVAPPVAVNPMSRAETRPFQSLEIRALIDPRAPFGG